MKSCPTCGRTFYEDHLSFCTDDGTPLTDEGIVSSYDGQATLINPPPSVTTPTPPPRATEAYKGNDWPTPPKWGSADLQPKPAVPYTPSPQNWGASPPAAYPATPGYYVAQPRPHGLAIASLIMGAIALLSFFCFGFVAGPIGLVLGIIAFIQIRNDPRRYSGRGLAIAGISLGAFAMVLHFLFILLSAVGGR